MKILTRKDKNRRPSDRIDLGFSRYDSRLLDKENNEDRPIQVLAKDHSPIIKDGRLENKQYCGECRTELMLLPNTQKLLCSSCGNSIDIMTNTPMVSTDQNLRPFSSQFSDPNYEDDGSKPFIASLSTDDYNEEDNPNCEITNLSGDSRILRIRLKDRQSISEEEIRKEIKKKAMPF